MTIRLARLDRTGHLNGVAEQQQFFGHGGFTRIRVRNDGEGSALLNLLKKFRTHRDWILRVYTETYTTDVYQTIRRLMYQF